MSRSDDDLPMVAKLDAPRWRVVANTAATMAASPDSRVITVVLKPTKDPMLSDVSFIVFCQPMDYLTAALGLLSKVRDGLDLDDRALSMIDALLAECGTVDKREERLQ